MEAIEITRAIISGRYSNDELNSIIESIRFARSQLGKRVKRSVTLGCMVSFVNKRGMTVTGRVNKIMTKNVIVATQTGNWRVPANMLTVEGV